MTGEFEIIRGSVDSKEKYCRIPVRSRVDDQMMEDGETELDAEKILSMPHDKAVRIIDAIVADWQYWLKRAGELYVLCKSVEVMK